MSQMFFDDDIPVWGFVGKVATPAKVAHSKAAEASKRFYLFTHFHFDISYNKDHVIELNVSTVSSDPRMTVDITGGRKGGG
jgi:transmembrane 9 superfamily protein 3